MERISILRLLRPAITRPQSVTSSTRHLSVLARRQGGFLKYSPRTTPSSASSTRYPALYCRETTRFYTTPSDSSPDALQPSRRNAGDEGNGQPVAGTEVPQRPTYQLTFTCKPCRHRSTHLVSKLSYHHGAVLIQCPNCKNRHIISDHLGIFSDKRQTLEDIMHEKGEFVKKGQLNEGGDIEFWNDEDDKPPSREVASSER